MYDKAMSRYFQSALATCSRCHLSTPRSSKACVHCGTYVPSRVRVSSPVRPVKRVDPRPALPALSDRALTFVYLITDGTYCKIGFAKDLALRFQALQNANPHNLSLIAAVETTQPKTLERLLHGLFAKKHHRNEWFRLITLDEWSAKLGEAETLLAATISSGIPQMKQEALNSGSI